MNWKMRTHVAGMGLVVLAAAAARAGDYDALMAKARQAMEHAAKSGRKLAAPSPPGEPHKPTAAEEKRGLVVFQPPMHEAFQDRPPAAGEVRDAVELRAALGETESCLVAVHALRDQKHLGWSPAAAMPAGVRLEALPVILAPMAERRSDGYRVAGMWLADGGWVDVPAGHSRAWLLRMHISGSAKPGEHVVRCVLSGQAGRAAGAELTVCLRVLPFGLVDPWQRRYTFGAFCAGANFSEAQYAGMKAHGIEAILWFWGHYGLDVRNESGKLRMGFAELDQTVRRFQKAHLRGPIVLALGNDSCGHFERAICQAFKLPMQPRVQRRGKVVQLAVLEDPRIEELMVEALRQLFAHAEAGRWPEIAILPYDEPTERLMDEHRRMVGLFRKHFPKVRLYGVTMDRLNLARMVLDTDILVCNGDFARIRALATENRKSAWFYGSVTTAQGYAGCRWRYGLRSYAYGADGMWFWCYNFHVGDPWNDFDGSTPDSSWVICWPPVKEGGASVETLAYEGLREAVDDVRYAMTLEQMLVEGGRSGALEALGAEYQQWRKGLQAARPEPAQIARYRDWLIERILAARTAPRR
jgi:hypothetical protein